MLSSLDFSIFAAINSMAQKSAVLDFLGIFFANYLIWLLFFIVIIIGFLPPATRKETLSQANAAKSILGALLGGGLALLLGQFFSRPRPLFLSWVKVLIPEPLISNSFPSLHTTLAFAFACTLFLFNKKIGSWFLAFAFLIGIARVYVGVHYPSDILFGIIIGCFSSFVIKKLAPRFR